MNNFKLNSNAPNGELHTKWEDYKKTLNKLTPEEANKYKVIIIGTGLAGASAAATLAEKGFNIHAFSYHESPRRAHSIAAQGGINAAKNYQQDGDSVMRLFYDTIKGGDFRSREDNVYRLAELSVNIIDQCVAQGVPFAREYGGLLDNRSFGGVQVSRTFYARGQTGQQLLLGAYSALSRQTNAGKVTFYPRHDMLDIVTVDGKAKGIVTRNLLNGKIESHSADVVILATGGYSNVYYLSTNAMASNVTANWRAHRKGALFANPSFTQIHPTCIPVKNDFQSKLTLMSESLRNDGRVWVPKKKNDTRKAVDIPEDERDYYLERIYPAFGNLVPRDVASRRAKEVCDNGQGVGNTGVAVYLDFKKAIKEKGEQFIKEKYGNLFDMYQNITDENPYKTPMKIYPAVHYTMGGLWVDYNLMTTIPGLFSIGESNFSDHGANRLGASALMQGLADGYFVAPHTVMDYLAKEKADFSNKTDHKEFTDAVKETEKDIENIMSIKGDLVVDEVHRELGKIVWDKVGMARDKKGLNYAIDSIPKIKEKFWNNVSIPGSDKDMNQELEKALRLKDFIELAELMAHDALDRNESCGAHFREEYQTPENEAERNDDDFKYVAAWGYNKNGKPSLFKEDLKYKNVKLKTRSYK
ncbi:MAG: fumarate reductase/succinate dehydrogenase flavoprotein subunit [Candidatus Neomarinimicrobiota bacterium]|tara:strand:+ start:11776 stop:13698 length:1923 start_codon:yes stop_codon:yes gene_type:complete